MAEPVAVRVRGCECPGTPHSDGDVVFVRPTLSLAGGLEAENDQSAALVETFAAAGTPPPGGFSKDQQSQMAIEMTERLRRKWLVTYVRNGAVGWNLVDEAGPIPFDLEAVLDDYGLGQAVAEKCDELYGETVARPLLARLATPSRPGRMVRSTSPRTSTSPRRERSSPASTVGSRR